MDRMSAVHRACIEHMHPVSDILRSRAGRCKNGGLWPSEDIAALVKEFANVMKERQSKPMIANAFAHLRSQDAKEHAKESP